MSHFLQTSTDTSNASEYTFSGVNLGTATSDRFIIVSSSVRKAGTTSSQLDSMTIAGITAVINVQAESTEDGNSCYSAIAIAKVTSGTSGDIVLTWGATMLRCLISTFRVLNLSGTTAHDTATDITDPLSTTLDIPSGNSVAIGESASGNTSITASWTGLTEDHDTEVEGMNMTCAHDAFSALESGRTIACNWGVNGETDPALVCASFAEAVAAAVDPVSWKSLLGVGA